MYVVSLTGFRPTPRYDETAWTQAEVQEGQTVEGPWEVIETVNLVPDTTPQTPDLVDITTENGTLAFGWYRVVFIDADGDRSMPTIPVSAGAQAPYLPSVEEVALWIRARTKDTNGNELGTFTSDTRPTAVEVEKLVALLAGSMVSCVGPWLPASLWQKSRFVISLKTAAVIEMSYFPEQIDDKRSSYEYLNAMYEREQQALCALAEDYVPDDLPSPTGDLPSFYFGDGVGVIWDVYWRPDREVWTGIGEGHVVTQALT